MSKSLQKEVASITDASEPLDARRIGTPRHLRRDLYLYLVDGSWLRLIVALAILYTLANTVFAGLYLLEAGSIRGAEASGFAQAFFFSVQTLSTIGFGGLIPGSLYGNTLVAVESAVGVFALAIVTGLVFAKVSRPRASALFSDGMVVTQFYGRPTLMFRVGNALGNEVVEADVSLTALTEELSPEGHHLHRLRDLKLVRSHQPLFVLSWTVMHRIDESSPLYGVDWTSPDNPITGFLATFTGHDDSYGQTTHARHQYSAGEVQPGRRFVDIIHRHDNKRLLVDYSLINDTVSDEREKAER